MRLEWTILGLQSGGDALRLDLRRQALCRANARCQAQPGYPHQAASLEGPKLPEREVKSRQPRPRQPVRDRLHNTAIDAADEAQRQVEVGRRDPAKIAGLRFTLGDVAAERFTMLLRQRQPKEGTNATAYFAVFFFQAFGAQELGAVGRQP